MEAIKNKGIAASQRSLSTQTPAKASTPVKRSLEHDSDGDHGEELMALLEEIDRVKPPCTFPSLPDLAAANPQSSTFFFSSEIEQPSLFEESMVDEIIAPRTTIENVIDKEPVAIDPRKNPDNVHQYLPDPFLPETFTMHNWINNIRSIKDSMYNDVQWSNLVSINDACRLSFGQKPALMLVMVKEVFANARNVGASLIDESGEVHATIHEKAFSGNNCKVHFGMTFLLRNPTIFTLTDDLDDNEQDHEVHLIVTPSNIINIFSNVHFL